ncbi:hypothetical protein SLEP1_g49399 [Rubroshorea leprosula]|uniref:Uncharacterized protein n=1 Tax=Rubroshorea leprosula TaxID=152421 RepID=A0AAV5LZR1_9ROSI|nr:hypothetical protein SLEP1_g49399 [Rubroshorea leprosula]
MRIFHGTGISLKWFDSSLLQVSAAHLAPDFFVEQEGTVNEQVDDELVRGARSLEDTYNRCNVAITEPSSFQQAANSEVWKAAMEELKMIRRIELGS